MAIRVFDTTDDELIFGGTFDVNSATKGVTILLVVKPGTTTAADASWMAIGLSGSANAGLFEFDDGRLAWASDDPNAAPGADTSLHPTDGAWGIVAVTKAAGSAVPTFHYKPLASGSWSHVVAQFAVGARSGSAGNQVALNRFLGGTGFPRGFRIGTAGVFDKALSDAEIEGVGTALTTQSIKDLSPIALWDFNQASTGTAPADLAGSATQSSIVGTTVATGDDPPSWTFGVSGGGAAPSNTVAPAITGTAQTGQTLTCSNGTWTNTPTSYTRQWKRNGTNISGATSSTYVLQGADEGQSIKCTVTATNASGSASADSNTVTPTAASSAGDDIYVRVSGAWVATNQKVRVSGAWV